ncbi:MAG: hypothetical protein ABI878_14420 [Acidobacteriota bacterium]
MNKKHLLPMILIIFAVLGCRQLLKPKRAAAPEMRVNVVDLAGEFKKDKRAANAKYAGRTVAVTGTVDTRVAYAPTIAFKTPDEIDFGVQCFFSKDGLESLKIVKSGSQYTFLGVVEEKTGEFLAITDCKVME